MVHRLFLFGGGGAGRELREVEEDNEECADVKRKIMDRKQRLNDIPFLGCLQTLLSMLTMTTVISFLNVAESAELRIPVSPQQSSDSRYVSAMVEDSKGTDPESSNLEQPLFLKDPVELKEMKTTTKTSIYDNVKPSNELSHSIENINDARLFNVAVVHSRFTTAKPPGQEKGSRKKMKRDIARNRIKRNKWSKEITKDEIKKNLHTTSNLLSEVNLHDNHAAMLKIARRSDRSVDSAMFPSGKTSFDRTENVTKQDPENATFHPDKILFDINETTAKKSVMRSVPNEARYITQEKAEKLRKKKRRPVQPLRVHPDELPIVSIDYESVPHETGPRDSQDSINLESRKLFDRRITSKRRSHYEKRSSTNVNRIEGVFELNNQSDFHLAESIPIDVSKSQGKGKKTVKKDLSRKSIADFHSMEKRRANNRKERSTVEVRLNEGVKNIDESADSLISKEQMSKRTLGTISGVTDTKSIESRWNGGDNTSYEFYKRRLQSDYPRIDVYVDNFYPEIPQIEDTYAEAFRKRRDVSKDAAERAKIEMRSSILGDHKKFSAKPDEVRRKIYPMPKNRRSTYKDLSHVRWEGHYIAGKK